MTRGKRTIQRDKDRDDTKRYRIMKYVYSIRSTTKLSVRCLDRRMSRSKDVSIDDYSKQKIARYKFDRYNRLVRIFPFFSWDDPRASFSFKRTEDTVSAWSRGGILNRPYRCVPPVASPTPLSANESPVHLQVLTVAATTERMPKNGERRSALYSAHVSRR